MSRPPWVLIASLALGACAVESPTPSEVDAGASPDAAAAADAAPQAPDATPVCADAVEPEPTRHHPAGYEYSAAGANGAGCLGQCHKDGLGPTFSVAGSLWDRRLAGGSPIGGATVVVIDADDKVVEMVTNLDGQFWTRSTLQPPIRTYATACPDSIPMVANATGNCVSGACHPSNAKIYLPPAPL